MNRTSANGRPCGQLPLEKTSTHCQQSVAGWLDGLVQTLDVLQERGHSLCPSRTSPIGPRTHGHKPSRSLQTHVDWRGKLPCTHQHPDESKATNCTNQTTNLNLSSIDTEFILKFQGCTILHKNQMREECIEGGWAKFVTPEPQWVVKTDWGGWSRSGWVECFVDPSHSFEAPRYLALFWSLADQIKNIYKTKK